MVTNLNDLHDLELEIQIEERSCSYFQRRDDNRCKKKRIKFNKIGALSMKTTLDRKLELRAKGSVPFCVSRINY